MQQIFIKIQSLLDTYQISTQNVPRHLICVLCHQILRNSVQTSCGCKACKSCMEIYLKDGPKSCPSGTPECQDVILNIKEDIFQDNASNKDVSNLTVNCPFSPCTISDKLMNLVSHIDECQFRQIICDKCSVVIIMIDKVSHEETSCEMRQVTCLHCSQILTHKNLIEDHLNLDSENLCSRMIGKCPNKCDVQEAVNLKDHMKNCKNKKIQCPFHILGCGVSKMTEHDLIGHIHDNSINHMTLLNTKLKCQDHKLNLSLKQSDQQQNFNELLLVFEKMSKRLLKQEKEIEALQKQIQITNSSHNPQLEKPIIYRNGIYIWKIDNFSQKRRNAELGDKLSITSEPFYTSDFGYKMCLRIYPAGDGSGKGTHLSIFFAVMKGDYDDIISWPFKQKVTLSLLDVVSRTKDISDTFKPDASSACYSQPTNEYNVASGSPKFVLLDKIERVSVYCVNDTIYVKVSVDTTGFNK